MVSAGGGGILFVLAISAKAILRATRRAQDNPNMGIARVLAAGYCSAMTLFVLLGLIGGTSRGGPMRAMRGGNAFPDGVNPPQYDADAFLQRSRKEHEAMMASMEEDRKRRQAEVDAMMKASIRGDAPPPHIPPQPMNPMEQRASDLGVTQPGIKRYPITLPLPANSRRVDADMSLVPGLKLSACYAASWCKVTIIQVNDDGTLRMNWDDYPSFTYDMAKEDMIIDNETFETNGN